MLDGVDPAGREGPAVAHPLDAEGDRLGVVARPHEVRVEGVQATVGPALDRADGPAAGHDPLREDLAAEDPPVRLLLALAAEEGDVLGEGLGEADGVGPGQAAGRRQRLDAHLRRAELLEVERGEEVEEGRGLLGRHPANPSQATSGREGRWRATRSAEARPPRPPATVATARARRSAALVIVAGSST